MNGTRIHVSTGARYALEIVGEQDEYGLTENVYRFQASIVELAGQLDLAMMQGFLIEHEGREDICIKVLKTLDGRVRCKPIEIVEGVKATRIIQQGVDLQVDVSSSKILLLSNPIILGIDSDKKPGTRLIVSLRKHFQDLNLDVIVDLGTADEDEDFNSYFFPDLDALCLDTHSTRLVKGYWGKTQANSTRAYKFGVVYE